MRCGRCARAVRASKSRVWRWRRWRRSVRSCRCFARAAVRRPRLEVAGVALASLAALGALLSLFRPRGDASSTTVLVVAGVCALAFVVELWWALVPPRGQVMPLRAASGARVALTWLVMLTALV